MSRKPIEFRQLCMVVKTLLLREPTMDNSEWKARTSETLAKMGFAEPDDLEMVSRAMTQVEHALRRTLGPRPIPGLVKSAPSPETVPPPTEGRTSRPLGWDLVVQLMARLQGSAVSEPSSETPVVPELLAVDEFDALNEFWRAAGEPGADRLALLRAFAEIAIVRPAGWDSESIRAEASRHRLSAETCFGCHSGDVTDWHHVIQIQHGGSNYLRNRVALCRACHAAIHPWVSAERKTASSWYRVGLLRPAVQPIPRKESA